MRATGTHVDTRQINLAVTTTDTSSSPGVMRMFMVTACWTKVVLSFENRVIALLWAKHILIFDTMLATEDLTNLR